jgi:hypothetical protein
MNIQYKICIVIFFGLLAWVVVNTTSFVKSPKVEVLFSTDYLEAVGNFILMQVGISGVKNRVVIGADDF